MASSARAVLAAAAAAILVLASTVVPAVAVVGPPSNDTFGSATVAGPLPFYETLDTTAATTEAADAEAAGLCGIGPVQATVWYALTAPETRAFQADVTNSSYSAGVIVLTGSPGSLALVACRAGSVGFDVEVGVTYYILAYSSGSGGGSLHLAIGFAPPRGEDALQDWVDTMFGIQPTDASARYNGAAQTVKANTTGRLALVQLVLARASFTTKDLVVEIHAGDPAGVLLATSDPVSASDIPVGEIDGAPTTAAWIPVWFSEPPTFTAGEAFAIVIPPVPLYPTSDPAWGWGKANSNVYNEGVAYGGSGTGGTAHWSAMSSSDFAFQTVVEPLGWPKVIRYWDSNRFGTAVDISYNTFNPGVDVAYVANAYNFPDALAGAAAAGTVRGPVLLAAKGLPLDASTAAELQGLTPNKIVVLGGTGVISDAVLNALKPYAGPGGVVRYAGATRFGTAAQVSAHTFSPGVDVAYVANAFNFPDALAGAGAAGTVKGPVLLAAAGLPLDASTAAELARLQPKEIVVLGGTGVVSDAVLNALKGYTAGPVLRYAGASRFGTAAAISAGTFSPGVPVAYVANAYNFPDALAGAAAAGTVQGPVLLAAATGPLDGSTAAELTRLQPKRIVVLGGTGVVSDAVMGALGAYATGP